ncbi:MAG: quinonprotein alcohol dehydrogenase [Gammaproteobacteria bacterium]|nr:MAG: quinonprotein alcohol dehydrogenase [Gammaproteobacteria bacterium]
MKRTLQLLSIILCNCLPALCPAQQPAAIKPAPAFTAQQLLALPTGDWPTNGGNLYNQRYSPLTAINRDNVGQLKGVWRTHLNGSGLETKYSGEAQPLVHDGVIYISTGADDVFALSVETGAILWDYRANLDPNLTTVCCGWTNRGVALGDGKVFIGQLDAKLVALDQRTGKPVWITQTERWQEGYTITSAPLYYDGMVITGFAGAEYGIRGQVQAYDADDGSLLWTFYTIPGPGEPGHETWSQENEVWNNGGATVWQTPAVDPELGLVYFSTANPGPDYNGSVRPGDNLYSSSIVAIDAKTGQYRWHYQQVHHDIWDYDSSNPVILFDVKIGRKLRKAIVEVGKTGWAYILDRTNGKPLLGIKERRVPQELRQATAATQPYPIGDPIVPHSVDIPPLGFELINEGRIFTPFYGPQGVIVNPSLYGGANWPPSSYDPVKQVLYVCASDIPGKYIGGDRDFEIPPDGVNYTGGATGFADLPRMGIFAAVDMTTNKLVWRNRWRDHCYSGSVTTAGGVLFVGRNDGRLLALNTDNGMPLWEFQTGAGLNAPASVFEYKGEQYVVALSAGNVLINSAHGDSVWLFGLKGAIDQAAPADTPLAGLDLPALQRVGAADLAQGERIFQQTCQPCHGADGQGGHGGGAPLNKGADLATLRRAVTSGKNAMPAFGNALTGQQIMDVSSYVLESLTNFPLPPGEGQGEGNKK